jgi:hypothetical protein
VAAELWRPGEEDSMRDAGGYEPPVLIELGGFFALTSGQPVGFKMDFTKQYAA